MSPTAPRRRLPKTEAEFLDRQQANALQAMRQTAGDLGNTLKKLADVHPWVTLGGAAVAGALAARALTPSPARTPVPPPTSQPGLFASLERALVDIVKGVAESSILNALGSYDSGRPAHNGADDNPAP